MGGRRVGLRVEDGGGRGHKRAGTVLYRDCGGG